MQNVANGSRKVSFRLHPFLRGTASRHVQFIVIYLATVYRLETSAGQCFDRAVRDLTPRNTKLVLCGVRNGSGVHADFDRAGVDILFSGSDNGEKGIVASYRMASEPRR